MSEVNASKRANLFEILFQLVLHGLILVFFAVSRRHPEITTAEWVYFLFYASGCLLINYYLLPRFLYRKQYLKFGLGLVLIIGLFILVEEQVLETIFYPDRAGYFPGIFVSLVEILPVVTALIATKLAWDAHRGQARIRELSTVIEESELKFLRSQIDPHFLFNNLNNLYAYAIEGSPKTPTIILELAAVLRYVLYECRDKYVPLNKELEQLKNYVQLNELQIEDRGQVVVDLPKVDTNYLVAPLLMIVFVENAFKHSQAGQAEGIEIQISAKMTPHNWLEFNCVNNFRSLDKTGELPKGIGLANARKRLTLLYPLRHELEIETAERKYSVKLRLQLHKKA